MYTVHGLAMSGNCYKVKLALSQLDKPFQWNEVDMKKRRASHARLSGDEPERQGARAADRRQHLSAGIECDSVLPGPGVQSVSGRSLGAGAGDAMVVFFEQYSHEPQLAVARFIVYFADRPAAREDELQSCIAGSTRCWQ